MYTYVFYKSLCHSLTLDLLLFTITLHTPNFTQIMMEGFSYVITTKSYVNVWKLHTIALFCRSVMIITM